MEPVIAYKLFTSIDMLARVCRTLGNRCVNGITANRERMRKMVEDSIGLATALNPIIGYDKSSEIAHEALISGHSVYEIVLGKGYLTRKELDDLLWPKSVICPKYLNSSAER